MENTKPFTENSLRLGDLISKISEEIASPDANNNLRNF